MSELLIKENGKVNISFANVLHLQDEYGKIVGVIHAIAEYEYLDDTKETQKGVQHLTQVFFSKGYAHVCTGFQIGYEDGMKTERFFKVNALKAVVSMIPSWPLETDGDILFSLGLEDITKTKYFVFSIPKNISTIDNIKNSRGYLAFNKAIDILKQEDEDIIPVGEKND